MSATALAEYLILQADGQQKVLHNSRFVGPIVGTNSEAVRALRAYHCDPRRDHSALDAVKAELKLRSTNQEVRPKARDEARRCAEAITLFQRAENVLGMRAMALRECPVLSPLVIEGVIVSIRPDVLVGSSDDRVGAGIIRVAKSPDPAECKLDATRQKRGEHRREMGRYMVALLQMLLEAQAPALGTPDRDLCFVADVRLPERIGPAKDHTVRLRAIRSACRQIVKLWPDIEPRPSILVRQPPP